MRSCSSDCRIEPHTRWRVGHSQKWISAPRQSNAQLELKLSINVIGWLTQNYTTIWMIWWNAKTFLFSSSKTLWAHQASKKLLFFLPFQIVMCFFANLLIIWWALRFILWPSWGIQTSSLGITAWEDLQLFSVYTKKKIKSIQYVWVLDWWSWTSQAIWRYQFGFYDSFKQLIKGKITRAHIKLN